MAIRISARPKKIAVGKNKGKKVYKLTPDFNNRLSTDAVCSRAAKKTGISKYLMQSCFRAIADELRMYLPLGNSIKLEGLGTFRLSMRAKTVEDLNDVSVDNIDKLGIVFTPDKEILESLSDEPLRITCYDEKGKVVRRVGKKEDE